MKAQEFDQKFDDGEEDIIDMLDLSRARRPNREKENIELKLPLWMIRQLETEAEKQGISPQTFLENYLVENFAPVS